MGGPEALECEDEALYGREYLDWKKQTLGTQVGAAVAEDLDKVNKMLNHFNSTVGVDLVLPFDILV